jgi:hypothetical protein
MISKNTICMIFLIYLFSLFAFVNEPKLLSLIGINIYCMSDILLPPKLKNDMFLHHILCIILSSGGLLNNFISWKTIKIFLETEYSTPFLVLHKFGIKNNFLFFLFFLTFTYFRILKLGVILLYSFYNQNIYNYPLYMIYSFYLLY